MPETLLPREFVGGRLRRLRPHDFESFQAYRSIPCLGQFQGWSPMSEAEAVVFLEEMSAAPLFTMGLQLLFAATAVTSVLGVTDERNLSSIKLLERLGFDLVETRQVVFRGEPCMERVYALARDDDQPLDKPTDNGMRRLS